MIDKLVGMEDRTPRPGQCKWEGIRDKEEIAAAASVEPPCGSPGEVITESGIEFVHDPRP